jgi:hypothetical protein
MVTGKLNEQSYNENCRKSVWDHAKPYSSVRTRYREARTGHYDARGLRTGVYNAHGLTAVQTEVYSEPHRFPGDTSLYTQRLRNHVIRSPRVWDIDIRAAFYNIAEQETSDSILMLGEIKPLLIQKTEYPAPRSSRYHTPPINLILDDPFRNQLFFVARVCQAIKHPLFGNEIFGVPFGFSAYGSWFRRSLLLPGNVLLIDLGPILQEDGQWAEDQTAQIELMDIHTLLTYRRDDPRSLFYQLTKDSTIHEGAGKAFASYLKMIGQWYIDVHMGKELVMELSGRVARVENVTIESMAQACAEVTFALAKERYDLTNDEADQGEHRDVPSRGTNYKRRHPERGDNAGFSSRQTSTRFKDRVDDPLRGNRELPYLRPRPSQRPDHNSEAPRSRRKGAQPLRIPDADVSKRDMMHEMIHERAEKNGQTLTSLKVERTLYNSHPMTEEQRRAYHEMFRAALEGGETAETLLAMF